MHQQTRSWLLGREPELAGRLEHCWDIAFNEWLPAVNANNGSFNSFPHLRNLEMYLDEILFAKHTDVQDKTVIEALDLTPSEVYVMLFSILFHDLGKSYSTKDEYSHACESRSTLAKSYKDLGLESEELALCIGRICHFHDPEKKDVNAIISSKSSGVEEKALPIRLRDVTITGYGVIREKLLGALLVLIDHQDGTFSRVLPHYVRMNNFGDIGKFRARIPGIRVDLPARMVVTSVKTSHIGKINKSDNIILCLNNKSPELEKRKILKSLRIETGGGIDPEESLLKIEDLVSNLKGDIAKRTRDDIENAIKGIRDSFVELQNGTACHGYDIELKSLWSLIRGWNKDRMNDSGSVVKTKKGKVMEQVFNLLPLTEERNRWSLPSLFVARNMAFLESKSATIEQQEIFLLSTIAGNTLENARSLKNISGALRAYGIPLYAWLLECNEHLYTCFGAETYEPLLSEDFLGRLAQAMWNKSTRVFGRRIFTYEGLASDLREARVERVRMGVRRLAIITRTPGLDKNIDDESYRIQSLQDGWHWNTTALCLRTLITEYIKKLVKPNSHLKETPNEEKNV